MPQIYKNRILKFLKREEYQPLKLAQLAQALGVGDDAYAEFKVAFDELRRAGHVVIGSGNLVTLPAMAGQVVGHLPVQPEGLRVRLSRWSRTRTATCSSRPTARPTP